MFCFRRRSGIMATLTCCVLGFLPLAWAQTSPCDLDASGSVNNADVTLAIGMALGALPCTANLEGAQVCTVISVQRIIDASLGALCSVYNAHAANLSWTASTTPGVTYNVYRATAPAGPFVTPLNLLPIAGTTYKDTTVQAGQTYYYVATAVAPNGTESDFSSPPIQAAIPAP